jgi:hypothetical protein
MSITNFKFPLFQMIDNSCPIEESNFFLQHVIDQALRCSQNNLEIEKDIQKILNKEFALIYVKAKDPESLSDNDKDVYDKILLIFQLGEINKSLSQKKSSRKARLK